MQYLLLIYGDETKDAARSEAENKEMFAGYMKFNETAKKAGALLGGDALQPTSTATTVRLREGKVLSTDGPFAETREALGGYYLVECENLDQAIDLARQIPHAELGCVEVRPIMVIDM